MILAAVVGGAMDLIGTWVKGKVETTAAITKANVAIQVKKAEADVNWDQIMAEGSRSSWKDEYLTILVSIPFIMVFMPWTRDAAKEGFEALNTIVPDEYWYLMGLVFAASFGVKKVMEAFKK